MESSASHSSTLRVEDNVHKCANLLRHFFLSIPMMQPVDGAKLHQLINQLINSQIRPQQFCMEFQRLTGARSGSAFQQLLENGLDGVREMLATKRLYLAGIELIAPKTQSPAPQPPTQPLALPPTAPPPTVPLITSKTQSPAPPPTVPPPTAPPPDPAVGSTPWDQRRNNTAQKLRYLAHRNQLGATTTAPPPVLRPVVSTPWDRLGNNPAQNLRYFAHRNQLAATTTAPPPPTAPPPVLTAVGTTPWDRRGNNPAQKQRYLAHRNQLAATTTAPPPPTAPPPVLTAVGSTPWHRRWNNPAQRLRHPEHGNPLGATTTAPPLTAPSPVLTTVGTTPWDRLGNNPAQKLRYLQHGKSLVATTPTSRPSTPQPPTPPPSTPPPSTPPPSTPPPPELNPSDQFLLTYIGASDDLIGPAYEIIDAPCELKKKFYDTSTDRSCEDVQLLSGGPLRKLIRQNMRKNGIRECEDVVPKIISHACEWRLKDIVEKLCTLARNGQARTNSNSAKKVKPSYRITRHDLLGALEDDKQMCKSHFLHKLYM